MLTKEHIADWFKTLQDSICAGLEQADGKAAFREDLWERLGGGGGRSRVIEDGAVFEKGGVNFSAVHGDLDPRMLRTLEMPEDKSRFFATGVSIVIHPNSPLVPIIHMNVRYFELDGGTSWFGGGIDLTPVYVREDQACWFHRQLKAVCDKHDPSYYPKFKTWADDYFYNRHRHETRGVGGIFFDRLQPQNNQTKEELFRFVQEVGEAFLPAYTTLVAENKQLGFTPEQKEWQLLRRGRYVEFNLVYDRGTRFGLETEGRVESILMSLPRYAGWAYNHQPEPGTEEQKTLELLKKNIDWANRC